MLPYFSPLPRKAASAKVNKKPSLAKTIASCERGRQSPWYHLFSSAHHCAGLVEPPKRLLLPLSRAASRRSILVAFPYAARGMYSVLGTLRVSHRPTLLSKAIPSLLVSAQTLYISTIAHPKKSSQPPQRPKANIFHGFAHINESPLFSSLLLRSEGIAMNEGGVSLSVLALRAQ